MRMHQLFLYLCVFFFSVIYACRETEDVLGNEPPTPDVPALPQALAGNWLDSWSLSMQHGFDSLLYNPQTKVWFRGSYDPWSMNPVPGFGIQLQSDGDFIWAVVASTSTGGCQVYTAEYIKGEIAVDGNILTFTPQTRRKKYHSVCNPGNNFDRNEDTAGFSLTYTLSTTANNSGQIFDVLTLTNPDGSQIQYLRLKS